MMVQGRDAPSCEWTRWPFCCGLSDWAGRVQKVSGRPRLRPYAVWADSSDGV